MAASSQPFRANRRVLLVAEVIALGVLAVAVIVTVLVTRGPPGPAEIVVSNVWARAMPAGAATGAVYLTIENDGGETDRLLSATTPVAGGVMIHQTAIANDIATMTELGDGVPVTGGAEVRFAPNGNHLMLMDLPAPLAEGQTFPLTLNFSATGAVETTVTVMGIGAAGPTAARQ